MDNEDDTPFGLGQQGGVAHTQLAIPQMFLKFIWEVSVVELRDTTIFVQVDNHVFISDSFNISEMCFFLIPMHFFLGPS
jgi:hypothetical protein